MTTDRTTEEQYEHIKTAIIAAVDEEVGITQMVADWWDEKIEQCIYKKKNKSTKSFSKRTMMLDG